MAMRRRKGGNRYGRPRKLGAKRRQTTTAGRRPETDTGSIVAKRQSGSTSPGEAPSRRRCSLLRRLPRGHGLLHAGKCKKQLVVKFRSLVCCVLPCDRVLASGQTIVDVRLYITPPPSR
jgi:hypothetical protein